MLEERELPRKSVQQRAGALLSVTNAEEKGTLPGDAGQMFTGAARYRETKTLDVSPALGEESTRT